MVSCNFLEDQTLVERFHQALRKDPRPALQAAKSSRELYQSRGIEVLDWVGWPLRPLFVPLAHLEYLSRSVWLQVDRSRQELLRRATDPRAVAELTPLPLDFLESLDLVDGLDCPWVLSTMRPDGFLYEDRFLISELNCGNGSLVSNAYQEVLFHHLASSPILGELGLDPQRGFPRSFQAYLDMLESHLETPTRGRRPLLGLLAHHEEWETIAGWHARVIHQVHHARLLLQERGVDTQLLTEKSLRISRFGRCANSQGRHLQGLAMVTLGTTFVYETARFSQELPFLRSSRVANLPLLKPLATLLFEKTLMPWMDANLPWPCQDPELSDFQVSLIPSRFPRPEEAVNLRLQHKDSVLKRSFDGKHTLMGNACSGREWNRTLERATQSKDYILQPRLALPKTVMPVSRNGESVEWLEVMVEISPFIINGLFCGAMARYCPYNEGAILSPPPDDMGMTLVYAVP